MKYTSIYQPANRQVLQALAPEKSVAQAIEDYQRPREDYLATSEELPIFAVADGVTLDIDQLLKNNEKYPDPSPAGEVAKLFCNATIKESERRYNSLTKEDISKIFNKANGQVKKYNQRVGQNDISGNPTGFYAATGAFVIIKNQKAYWASICDSFVAHFDQEMNKEFISSGTCRPYAVINGEKRMVNHLESGVFELQKRYRILTFTDGFEPYIKNSEFLELFKNWNPGLKGRIEELSQDKQAENPEKYGHERSLIATVV